MSTINYAQERGFPAKKNSCFKPDSDDRKKLDGFRLFDTGNPQDTQNSETNSTFSLRKSLAWDSAFFTSPGVLEPEELLQTMNSPATGNAINLLGNEEEILLPSESLESNRTREFETSSFRKSLAWDNAFYTSSGVLDPEELSIVNKGFKKCETQKLPGVEEIWRCAESISTMDSSSSSLTSLEFELFDDKRSSMQKPTSLKSKRGLQNVHSSKKTDASSRMRVSLVSQNGAPNRYGKLKPPRNLDGKKNAQKVLNRVNKDHTKENEVPNRQQNIDRENTEDFKNQIEGLTKQVGAIDLGCDVVMELKGDKNVFHT